MPTETLSPDAIISSTNLAGAVTAIDEPVPYYLPNAVVFDGTNDNLTRGAQYTGVSADSGLFTFAAALKFTGTAADTHILAGGTSATRYVIGRGTSNDLYVFMRNSGGTTVLEINGTVMTSGQWYAILMSVDLSNAAKRHLYIDDGDALTVTTYSIGGSIDFTVTGNAVSSGWGGINQRFAGEIADLWFDIGRYVDFSVEANRRKFFNSSNAVVDKGSDGSTPFSAAPTVFLSGITADWHTNKGAGGGFTEVGALTDSASPPFGA